MAIVALVGVGMGWLAFAPSGWSPAELFSMMLTQAERLRADLPNYGALAPLAYIALYAGQIVVAPIPGHGLSFTAGYLFGPLAAALYSLIGIWLGSGLAFGAARRIGWPLIEKMAPRSWIERWRGLVLGVALDHG